MSRPEDSALNPVNEGPASSSDWKLPGELMSLEAKLAALCPRDDRLDRERLMFLAGQASVEATKELPRTLLGLKLDHWALPPAFATMTAVAATLFALLLTRPAVVEPQPTSATDVEIANSAQQPDRSLKASDDRVEMRRNAIAPFRRQPSESATALLDRDNELSTSHAYHRDIEQLLATEKVIPKDVNAATRLPVYDRDRTILTPSAWHQILNGSESVGPPANDSSSLPTFRGIHS